MIHSFQGQLTGTNKELCQRLLPYAMRTTHILDPLLETLFLVYPTRFQLEGEDLFITLFPVPKQSLAYLRPSTNICQINEFKSVTLKCLQLKFLE